MSYVEKSKKNALETITTVRQELDKYWTPANGHAISEKSTFEKIEDFLTVTDSGLRTACSEEESLQWFILRCNLLNIIDDLMSHQ